MKKSRRKAAAPALALTLAALVAAGCGSEDEPTRVEKPPLSADTANRLASLSEQIATDLNADETCDAAYAADQLQDAVDRADLAATLRPGVEEVATRLVNEVNCPPPPPPKPKKKKKDEEDKHGERGGEGPPGHSGGVPPGQAKLKGEAG